MNWPSITQQFIAVLKIVGLVTGILAAAAVIVTMALAIFSIEVKAPELGLIIVLAIAALFILTASFLATAVHKAVHPQSTNSENGEILREAMLRFTWLTAPIAGS